MADQAGASLAGRDYFHGNRSIYNFDRFDQWRNGRIWRRIADTDNGLCAGSRRTGRDPLWGIIVVRIYREECWEISGFREERI